MGSTLKRIWGYLVVLVLAFIPSMVSAEELISYLEYSNVLSGEESIGASVSYNDEECFDYQFYMNDKPNYSFELKGYNLKENETYKVSLTSDFLDYSVTYSGDELMDGVAISRDDGDSTMYSNVYFESTGEKVMVRVFTNNKYYYIDETSFRFNDNFDSSEIDTYFKEIAPNGTIEINSIKLDDLDFMETCISAALSKYNTDNFWVYGYCYPTYDDCSLYISDTRYNYRSKEFEVEYIFQDTDEDIVTKVDKYVEKFEGNIKENDEGFIEPNFFILDDLENINYKYTIVKHGKEDMNIINSVINYSSEIKEILEYGNLTAIIDTRAGWGGEPFSSGCFGFLNLLYDGVIYGVADRVGVKQINVLYVDDSTIDTRDAYIEAALKRVSDYLPNAKVTLTYAGKIDELDQTGWGRTVDELIDVNKTLGEYYTLTIDGTEFSFLIVKDSSKMKNPEMNTVDLKTNIKINSDSYEVPLDSKISANVINKNSKDYKDIISKLKLDTGMVVDLKLYSDSSETYVTKLSNGMFKVFIPLTKEYENKDLKAYYIKDDGDIEIYKIRKENGYAVFETSHFSTYTIGGNDLTNPDTIDGIGIWFLLVVVSGIGIISIFKKRLKYN